MAVSTIGGGGAREEMDGRAEVVAPGEPGPGEEEGGYGGERPAPSERVLVESERTDGPAPAFERFLSRALTPLLEVEVVRPVAEVWEREGAIAELVAALAESRELLLVAGA